MVDITKVTSIPDDIPEDAKETLKQKLNIWTVGAVYVYDAETVDYDNTVTTSLDNPTLLKSSDALPTLIFASISNVELI